MKRIMRSPSGLRAAALWLLVVCWSATATADIAAAEVLFNEGRKLMTEGKLELACPKLAESHRLDPSPAALGSLAQCHEKQGKTASAWAEYLASARLAEQQKKTSIAAAAQERANALKGKLLYLTIKVESPVVGLVVRRGEEIVAQASYDTKLPVDPGRWTLSAEAPEHERFTTDITLQEGTPENSVTIPALKKKSASTPPAVPGPTTSAAPSPSASNPTPSASILASTEALPAAAGRPTVGYVLGGVGLAALGVGAFFGASSLSEYNKAKDLCSSRIDCNQDALDARDRAGSKATIANVSVGLGVVGLAVGSYLLFFSSSGSGSGSGSSSGSGSGASSSSLRLDGSVARNGAGLLLSGGF